MKVISEKILYYLHQIPPILRSATVETALFLLMVSSLGVYTICEDLALEKACKVNLGFDDNICANIQHRNKSLIKEEEAIQILVSTVKQAHSVIDYGIPIILILFLGPLSDVFGRKIPMLLCISGYLLQYVGAILSAYFIHWDLWIFKFIISTSRAIGGGEAAYNMAAISYISDITQNNHTLRTVRMGILYSCFIAGVPVGAAYGARISSLDIGYVGSLAIAGAPGLISFLIILIFVKNTKNIQRSKEVEGLKCLEIFKYIISPSSTWVKVFNTMSRKREGWNRFNIYILLLSHFCVMAPMSAEFTVKYLFLRIQLNWNLVQFADFNTFSYVIGIIGVILSMGILSYYLNLSDPTVGFISGFSQFISCFIYTFAKTSLMMYLAPVVDMMNGTMVVINKSILSKLVSREEVGNLFAFVGMVDSVSPLLLVPTYNAVYKATLENLPGTFYLLSAGMTIPAFIVYAWLISWDIKSGIGFFQSEKSSSEICITRL